MKKASIIGLGNIFKGDLGVACYVVDALRQEPLGDAVELSYLGENSFYAGPFVCGTEFAIVVQAINMGGPPGRIHCWDKCAFEQNFHWFAGQVGLLPRSFDRVESENEKNGPERGQQQVG